MAKKKRGHNKKGASALTPQTSAEKQVPSWQSIKLKKCEGSKASLLKNTTVSKNKEVENGNARPCFLQHAKEALDQKGGEQNTVRAVRSFATPNFKGKLRTLAEQYDFQKPPRPDQTFKAIAGIYAEVDGQQGLLTKSSCKSLFKELDLFKPPRNYITLAGFEIAWTQSSKQNSCRDNSCMTLMQFKKVLIPAVAKAVKPNPCTPQVLWSRLCLNSVLILKRFQPKKVRASKLKQSQGKSSDNHTIVQSKVPLGANNLAQENNFGRRRKGKKGKKMGIQEFHAQTKKQELDATKIALAAARKHATSTATTQQPSQSLRDIMEREARMKLYRNTQAQAAAKVIFIWQ